VTRWGASQGTRFLQAVDGAIETISTQPLHFAVIEKDRRKDRRKAGFLQTP